MSFKVAKIFYNTLFNATCLFHFAKAKAKIAWSRNKKGILVLLTTALLALGVLYASGSHAEDKVPEQICMTPMELQRNYDYIYEASGHESWEQAKQFVVRACRSHGKILIPIEGKDYYIECKVAEEI